MLALNIDADHWDRFMDPLAAYPINALGPYDVIAGRHRDALNHIGNRRFRVTVSIYLDRYLNTDKKTERSQVIKEIIATVHQNGGRFLRRLKNGWQELDERQAREKVGHALRDMTNRNSISSSGSSNEMSWLFGTDDSQDQSGDFE